MEERLERGSGREREREETGVSVYTALGVGGERKRLYNNSVMN